MFAPPLQNYVFKKYVIITVLMIIVFYFLNYTKNSHVNHLYRPGLGQAGARVKSQSKKQRKHRPFKGLFVPKKIASKTAPFVKAQPRDTMEYKLLPRPVCNVAYNMLPCYIICNVGYNM